MLENYDDILDIEAMMEILAIGRNKAYELLKNGEIQSFKIGKAYRIPRECVHSYIMNKLRVGAIQDI